ncbi:MAG TPA: hypothetical protein VE177_03750, partial [Candidatus Binatus sp.]|nr:hypothetical protein [Candidatus Binatus sp.]
MRSLENIRGGFVYGLAQMDKVRCPHCGQLVPQSAIDRKKGNCFYCSGVPTSNIRQQLAAMKT